MNDKTTIETKIENDESDVGDADEAPAVLPCIPQELRQRTLSEGCYSDRPPRFRGLRSVSHSYIGRHRLYKSPSDIIRGWSRASIASVTSSGSYPARICPASENLLYQKTFSDRVFRPILRKNFIPSETPTKWEKIKYVFLCPPVGRLARSLSLMLIVVLMWAIVWSLFDAAALPGGHFFALFTLVILSMVAGWAVGFLHLPPLLGMLVMGVLLRNVPGIDVAMNLDKSLSATLRNVALVVILIRAGLGLDPTALKRLAFVCVRLAFTPCIIECIIVATMSHILLDLPWDWAFLLGFVLAAVSPAVVVSSLIGIQERGLGVIKGIPTLIIAAASIDDVLAISGFSVVLSITFATGGLVWTIFRGPLEMIVGIAFGLLAGFMTWYLPEATADTVVLQRFVLLFGGGLFSIFGSKAVEFSGAGALGCLTMAFVSAYSWRINGWSDNKNPVTDIMTVLWVVFQPTLFGLIGAEIDVRVIELHTIGMGTAVLFIGLLGRVVASIVSVSFAGLNWKEKLFLAFAWLPKATVQAAIGSIALDTARDRKSAPEVEKLGLKVLTVAVLSILITAPLGSAAIALSAPKLLTDDTVHVLEVIREAEEVASGDIIAEEMAVKKENHIHHNVVHSV